MTAASFHESRRTRRNHDKRALRRQRRRSLVSTTVLSVAAVLIGVTGAGGTYAFLNDSQTLPGATVTAGTLELQINGASSTDLGNLQASPLLPASRAFTITNVGQTPAELSGHIVATSTPSLLPHTLARLTPVASAAACTAGLSGTQSTLQGYASNSLGIINPNQTRWFCLEVGIVSGTSATHSGQSLNFTLTIDAEQR